METTPVKLGDYKCPYCGSTDVNNRSFDYYNFCRKCGKDWRAT